MTVRSFSRLAAILLLSPLLPDVPAAHTQPTVAAQQPVTLRIATLAPRGSAWDRAFRAWSNTLRTQTGGRLELQFFPGGSQGDERDYIRKMRAGQLDGAAITTTGLGQVVRPVLVLALPGLFSDYAVIDRVRETLDADFQAQFEAAGFRLLGWGDVGRARFFSRRPIQRPEDFRAVRPWAWREDVIFTEALAVIGANGQRLGVNEVLPALQTGRVDAFPASAYAAVALQWFNHVTHVTQQSDSIIVGATILKKERYDALPADLRAALDETARRAHGALARAIRQADDRAYQTLVSRGLTPVDLTPHRAAWQDVARQVRERLAGRLYERALLARVEQLARAGS
ncbi:MAG: TRAP transporter substrate-binding protein DctP [Myxococcota bacterium]|nr:TRAP transporter substrate-binding protein DctP [Myxococcota bacterium]MDW8361411.1 TRAP transporter substrate-binding protein DctP [Myxococcales bacterium]